MASFFIALIAATLCTQVQPIYLRAWKFRHAEISAGEFVESFIKIKERFIGTLESRMFNFTQVRIPAIPAKMYLDNPVVRLVMVRRLAKEWPSLLSMAKQTTDFSPRESWSEQVSWPTVEHVQHAARMLMRTQITYGYLTEDLSKGFMFGKCAANMTADDCFSVAKSYIDEEYYDESNKWLHHALMKIDLGDHTLSRKLLLPYFFTSLCLAGDIKESNRFYIDLSKEKSFPILPSKDIAHIQNGILDNGCKPLENFKEKNLLIEKHGMLCRGEVKVNSRLVCRYVHYQQPHLRFQPFKLEELHLDPPVVRFHQVITDLEADALRESALNSLQVALVNSPKGPVPSIYRTSEMTWAEPGQNAVHDLVARRMGDMTRLNFLTAEYNQVSRYGVSGEYFLHRDYISTRVPFTEQRIATLMFYLNDVKKGGNTVFLTWNLTVVPIKNSAIFWFNELRNGDVDSSSLHSGCPVLQGEKWVMNKWFHNRGNEVSAPCGININDSFAGFFQ